MRLSTALRFTQAPRGVALAFLLGASLLSVPARAQSGSEYVNANGSINVAAVRAARSRGVPPGAIASAITRASGQSAPVLAGFLGSLMAGSSDPSVRSVASEFIRGAVRADPSNAGAMTQAFLQAAPPSEAAAFTQVLIQAAPSAAPQIAQVAVQTVPSQAASITATAVQAAPPSQAGAVATAAVRGARQSGNPEVSRAAAQAAVSNAPAGQAQDVVNSLSSDNPDDSDVRAGIDTGASGRSDASSTPTGTGSAPSVPSAPSQSTLETQGTLVAIAEDIVQGTATATTVFDESGVSKI